MGGDMRSCHRLTCGTGSRAGRIFLFCFTRGRMSVKCGFAYVRHLEYPGAYPFSERFNGFSRPVVLWISFLEIWQDALSAINRPDGQGFMACLPHKLYD